MAKFEYATKGGELKSFEADSSEQALASLGGFEDAAATSGVREIKPITSGDLEEQAPAQVTQPKPSTESAGMQGQLESQTEGDQFVLNQQQQTSEAQKQKDSAQQQYINALLDQEGVEERTAEAYAEEGGVDDISRELADIDAQILSEQRALQNQVRLIEKNQRGLWGGAVEQEVARVTRDSLQTQADLSIIRQGLQGKHDSAKAIADRAVNVALEQQKNYLEALGITYQDSKDLLDKKEQRLFETQQADRERKFNEWALEKQSISDLSIAMLKAGAPMSVVLSARKSGSVDDALAVGGKYLMPQSSSELDQLLSLEEAEKYGVPYGTTKRDMLGKGIGESDVNDTLDQLKFLRDTVTKAQELSGASGASGLSKQVGDFLVGDTQFRQLEAQVNTLRTNVLTLVTDPSIKQFFGPQMSEADVRLMTSAGTTLNPESQSPEQLRAEITRLDDLFNRMETSLKDQTITDSRAITAPDGTRVIIID